MEIAKSIPAPDRNTIGVGQYSDKSGKIRNANGQFGTRGNAKVIEKEQPKLNDVENITGRLSTKEIGSSGEAIIVGKLKENGWEILTSIKNNSDNGIDMIGRGPQGQLGIFEVKTTLSGSIPKLSERQQNMADFVLDVLGKAMRGTTPYNNATIEQKELATNLYKEIKGNTTPVTGAVFGVNLKNGLITVSRWGRE